MTNRSVLLRCRNILPEAAKKGMAVDSKLERLQREVAAASTMSADEMDSHPPGKWCAAEVLEHLYLTYTGTIKGFERLLAAERPMVKPANWKQRAGFFLVVGFRHMPSGREAPSTTRPRGLPREKVIAEIAQKIADMDTAIRRCEEKHGANVKLLDHPILGALTGEQWRKFHLVHGRHHLKQIWRLRRDPAG